MKLNVNLPVAKAGEKLQVPTAVTAKLIKASARTTMVNTPEGEVAKPIIVLEFEDIPNVIRTLAQCKGDLSDMFNKEQLEKATPTFATAAYNRFFRGRNVSIKCAYHEEGAIQVVDETSNLFINGLNEVGDEVPTQGAGVWVEGFLSVSLTDAELDAIIERELKAMSEEAEADSALLI